MLRSKYTICLVLVFGLLGYVATPQGFRIASAEGDVATGGEALKTPPAGPVGSEESLSLRAELRGTGGDEPVLDVQCGHAFGHTVGVALALEIVDDRGRPLAHPQRLGRWQLRRGEQASRSVVLPAFASDGFYMARVSAAAATGEGEQSASMEEVFLHVEAGVVAPVEAEDYNARSEANVGQREPW
jgi:hypothetical protein